MKTVHGVTMSPRAARLWRYVRVERKIPLTDFSTDQCVERELPRLMAAAAELDRRIEESPGDPLLQQLAVDLAAIMRRRPVERV